MIRLTVFLHCLVEFVVIVVRQLHCACIDPTPSQYQSVLSVNSVKLALNSIIYKWTWLLHFGGKVPLTCKLKGKVEGGQMLTPLLIRKPWRVGMFGKQTCMLCLN